MKIQNKLYCEYLPDGKCEAYMSRNFRKIGELLETYCKYDLIKKKNYIDKDGLQLVVGNECLAIRKFDDWGASNKNIDGVTRDIPISCLFNVIAESDKFIKISNDLKDLISSDNLFIKNSRGIKSCKFVKFLFNTQNKKHKETYYHLKQFLYVLHNRLEVKWNF